MRNNYGELLQKIRMERKMIQKDVIGDLGSQSYMSKIESGYIDPPATILYYMSLNLGVDIKIFFENQSVDISEIKKKRKSSGKTMINCENQ